MISQIFEYINPTNAYVLITFIVGLIYLDIKKINNRILFIILCLSLATEIISAILAYYNKTIDALYTVSLFIHHSLWIYLLTKDFLEKKAVVIIITAFFITSILNFLFYEGIKNLNNYTFIIGALLYIVIFIYESFYQLKYDNFSFFTSNNYLLFFTPVLFFFGLSFMFSFNSKELLETTVFEKFELYPIIITFVNFIYYTFINIYIYKEKRLKNAG